MSHKHKKIGEYDYYIASKTKVKLYKDGEAEPLAIFSIPIMLGHIGWLENRNSMGGEKNGR